MLYARAASGYRPGGPRFLPLGLTPPPGFTDEFGSETLWNYEIGARPALFDRRLAMIGAISYIDWSNVHGFPAFGAFGGFGYAGGRSETRPGREECGRTGRLRRGR